MCTTMLPQAHFPKRSGVMDLSSMMSAHAPPTPRTIGDDPWRESESGSYFNIAMQPANPYEASPKLPLSPPDEDKQKCSLPSISSLLECAEDASLHAASMSQMKACCSPVLTDFFIGIERQRPNPRPIVAQNQSVPPTPPLRPDSAFHRSSHSPPLSVSSTATTASILSPPMYTRQPQPLPSPPSGAYQAAHTSPYSSPALSAASYPSPPESTTTPYYFQGQGQPMSAPSSYFKQRDGGMIPPLSTSPPSYLPPPAAATAAAAAAPTHHQTNAPSAPAYYYSPGSIPYQTQDRYICRVCNKAFSRPSSLRIHSHSHTGEKPFRCAHEGCGKCFSVRSNMKRHERGCHPRSAVSSGL